MRSNIVPRIILTLTFWKELCSVSIDVIMKLTLYAKDYIIIQFLKQSKKDIKSL